MIIHREREKNFLQHNVNEETRQEQNEERKKEKTETKCMINDLKIKCIRNKNNVCFRIRFEDRLSWISSGI